MRDIAVFIEHLDGEVDTLSLQLLNKARQLADKAGVKVVALVLGSELAGVAGTVSCNGADVVMAADHPELSIYNPELYTRVISKMIGDVSPSLVLLGYTFPGMEMAPAVSTRLGIPVFSNCVDVDIELAEDNSASIIRPVYSGTSHVKLKATLPLVVSIQKGSLARGTSIPKPFNLVPFSSLMGIGTLKTRVKEILKPSVGEVDITKASVIVGVGRGIGQASNLSLVRDLAECLGGVIAATRPVVDMGWLPAEYQVGLSGKTVSPKVYIACGISGAAQHVAGISESRVIVAINKDANAPIFNVAHYAIIGDLFEVVPAIIKAAGCR